MSPAQNNLPDNFCKSSNDLSRFIEKRAELAHVSCKSFIVTLFGDVISQHGGIVWLGSLIDSLKPLGFSERLIRTSVFRLVKDDWLEVKKVGRKSFYSFTESANNHYTKAARRIYARADNSASQSDGSWLILIPSAVGENKLSLLKRQLNWLGFSSLSSGAYAHPSIDKTSLEETLKELELTDSVIIFSSRLADENSAQALKKLVFEKWNINELQISYQMLLDDYQPFLSRLQSDNSYTSQQCYLLRTLLIHEYRRVLLKDHELPANMLPENWAGVRANKLIRQLYALLAKPSCQFIISQLQNEDGYLTRPVSDFNKRFK